MALVRCPIRAIVTPSDTLLRIGLLAKLRQQKDQEMLAKACQRQDLEWVTPAEFEQWKQGLWKCGDKWLDTAAANAFHADAKQPWYVASEHFVTLLRAESLDTLPRNLANRICNGGTHAS